MTLTKKDSIAICLLLATASAIAVFSENKRESVNSQESRAVTLTATFPAKETVKSGTFQYYKGNTAIEKPYIWNRN